MSAWSNSVSSVSWNGYQEWERYYQSLKKDFRYSLRSTHRRLALLGHLSFEAVTKYAEFQPIVSWLFSHKTEWLVRTNHDSPWQDAELYKKFLIKVAAETEEIGKLTLFVLKSDGRIIAAVLSRISRCKAEAVIGAFDRSYSQYGPGQLLYQEILKWALKWRLDFDFRIGNDSYKKRWTNRESHVISYRFVNSFWGIAFSLTSRCRSKLHLFRRHLFP